MERDEIVPATPGAAHDESELPGGFWRWTIVALALMLLAFPLARWTKPLKSDAAPDLSPAARALQISFEHFQAGRYQEAVTFAKAALEADPSMADAYNNLAVSYLKLGMLDEAERAANEAIRLRPDHTLARNNLAWIEQEKAKATSGSGAARSAEAGALVIQSGDHARARRYEACIDSASRAILLRPSSGAAFNNKGFCEANLHQWGAAVRDLEEAIRLAPTEQLFKNNLAWAQQETLKARGATPD